MPHEKGISKIQQHLKKMWRKEQKHLVKTI